MTDSFGRLGFAASDLERRPAERGSEPPAFAEAADARIVLVAGERVVLRAAGSVTALLGPEDAARVEDRRHEICLGSLAGRPVYAAAILPEAGAAFPESAFRIRDLRAIATEALVPAGEVGLLAAAKSLLAWHARHGFCAQCGSATVPRAGGFRRDCPACGATHFPRTDPVAIMLVRRGDTCLLGRAPHFPEAMYSCLAGFVEPGETIEAAVRRETFEETGVQVGAVRYRASQPWPFPSSLMIGCAAQATSEAITIDAAELADARWFGRDEVRAMVEGRHSAGLTLPPPMAIAHGLVLDFCEG